MVNMVIAVLSTLGLIIYAIIIWRMFTIHIPRILHEINAWPLYSKRNRSIQRPSTGKFALFIQASLKRKGAIFWNIILFFIRLIGRSYAYILATIFILRQNFERNRLTPPYFFTPRASTDIHSIK